LTNVNRRGKVVDINDDRRTQGVDMQDDTKPAADRRSFLDIQKDAALEDVRKQQAEFKRIADIVLPGRRDGIRRTSQRVTDVIALDGDHLVEITDGDKTMWTFVVAGKASNWRHRTQEQAILHLIATRYDANDNNSVHTVFFANRLFGIPMSDDDTA